MVFLPHWPKQTKLQDVIILGTERILKALEYFDHPEKKLPPVIIVAGTNGKGSTVAYIANILQVAGYKVHTYTSPHLVDFNERIVLRGSKISDAHLFRVMEECRIVVEKHSLFLTWFEVTTIGAMLAFSEVPADFLVMEVGMGGRSDATNVLDNPLLSVITSISFDHQEFLGDDLLSIAFEKAGIIKPNCPCVVGRQEDEQVLTLLSAYAETMESKAMICGSTGVSSWSCVKRDANSMLFSSEYLTADFPLPSLIGGHQIDNAGNAVASIALLNKTLNKGISNEQIAKGLATAYWPARMERIVSSKIVNMVPKGWEIYIDGAHNIGGAAALARWISDNNDDVPVYLVLGMTKNKDARGFLSVLKPYVKFVCGVCVQRELYSQRGEEISVVARELDIPTSAFDYIPSALTWIAGSESATNVKILICGSLYLVSDVKRIEDGVLI